MRRVALDAPCLRCGRDMVPRTWPRTPGTVTYKGRGYCRTCYDRVFLSPVPAVRSGRWRRDDLLEEWDRLRRDGVTMRQAVDRLGITYDALDKALIRAKAAGDQRAVRRVA